jgi:hypothetical protein
VADSSTIVYLSMSIANKASLILVTETTSNNDPVCRFGVLRQLLQY